MEKVERRAAPPELTLEEARPLVAGGCSIRYIPGANKNMLIAYSSSGVVRGMISPEILKELWLDGTLHLPRQESFVNDGF